MSIAWDKVAIEMRGAIVETGKRYNRLEALEVVNRHGSVLDTILPD